MKSNIWTRLLGTYNLILALGAIYIGILMLNSNYGIFTEYPKEWISKTPFESWVFIGIIVIVLFGFGNIIASILSFNKKHHKACVMSVIMGGILFICIVSQVIILREWYLATLQFMFLSIIQLCLSIYTFYRYRKTLMGS